MTRKYKILSIDGGGVRGIIPARILQEIEEKSGKPIHQLFDMIVGTSTGALIALALTRPEYEIHDPLNADSAIHMLPFPAQDVVALYENHACHIFYKSMIHDLKHGFNLWGPKYDRSSYDFLLKMIFQNSLFKQCKCKVVIPSYDLIRNRPIVLKSWENFQSATMQDIAGGVTAAPTYFSPVRVINQRAQSEEELVGLVQMRLEGESVSGSCTLIDGGIWANNPELIGVSEAMILNPELKREDIYILSLGTQKVGLTSLASKLQDAGIVGWMKSGLIDMMIDATSEWTEMVIKDLYPNMTRIEPYIAHTIGALDDASDEHMRTLLAIAEKYIANNEVVINEVIGHIL